ncbi:MAG: winged helix-turn-helix domain-containing protein [Caldilinea sp.]|uniref:winged helix-turn-helix domain-containing protein n=1 Tax=Caldilinea sp. TaxID=2293560 RepID=UPI002B9571DF|nr:winged helix-turn-helix domain-containing protein [Caldilinea sp.]
MPLTLRLLNGGGYMRRHDVENILRHLYAMQCVEIIGVSNIGKSALLRLLAQPDVWVQELGEAAQEFLPVYVDCNRILDMTEQGFCELVLRCLQEASPALGVLPELVHAYDMLVSPSSDFQVPLSFSRGLTAALESGPRKLVLLFDEFDDPYQQVDARVFLNLRAIQDRHNGQLIFVTASGRPLTLLNQDGRHDEFAEIFSHRSWYLAPLTRSDTELQVRRYMTAYEAAFTSADIDFIYQWSGGHPRMAEGVCRVLQAALEAAEPTPLDPMERWQFHRKLAATLLEDVYLARECSKIWCELTPEEQAELMALTLADHNPDHAVVDELLRRHLLRRVEGRPQLFCRLLAGFVQRQAAPAAPESTSLWVDTASGQVLVNGAPVETLTALEYRLMQLLFQNRDKIVDKYQIVTHVWGESYIDEVDDARIEKLISRLRQKIEPDPSSPNFLTTIRGRGYRLVVN